MPRRIVVTAFALLLSLSGAHADPSADDRAGMQGVISSQIEAFKRDDGATAFGFAGGPIQQMFQTPDNFLAMVRRGYPPVYRPKTVVFGAAIDGAAGPEQEVLISDENGVDWVAHYTLERQPDGSWRIVGCRLVKSEGGSA